jgi:acyl carrier protein
MDAIHTEVQQIFRDVFGDPEFVLIESVAAADVPGWDSLGHLNLIIALEKRLGLRFAAAEISRLKEDGQNAGSLLGLIRAKKGL